MGSNHTSRLLTKNIHNTSSKDTIDLMTNATDKTGMVGKIGKIDQKGNKGNKGNQEIVNSTRSMMITRGKASSGRGISGRRTRKRTSQRLKSQ